LRMNPLENIINIKHELEVFVIKCYGINLTVMPTHLIKVVITPNQFF